ncbi:iron complex transport system ATP-binding protein [Azospirillum agricola]|uniref:ABC transporter ATP-binding protein n=1 Tax=Azospirillum agricola TaxID=1720247 RepID=UPI001AE36C82|nr:ABC transporter ATP-binding protein [Azospirillum agricola]MBP2227864.1 iron complex transport system ATP-binding protein [Azospirillum agricola]
MRIDATAVSATAGGRGILSGVTLGIEAGRFTGLIGPNGAGKTTLLRILAGLAPPAAGSVTFDGESAARIGRRALARRIAYLAQDGPVHWPLRAEALVMLGRLPHRGTLGGITAADRTAVERALTTTGTLSLRHRIVGTLSGGERLRVLLARTLATEASLLLADEPVAALDPRHQLETMALLRDAARAGTGVVAVLHDLALAARFCDRLILLADGAVRADGPPEAVLTDERLRDSYGIAVHRGAVDGQPFLLPWTALSSASPKDTPPS